METQSVITASDLFSVCEQSSSARGQSYESCITTLCFVSSDTTCYDNVYRYNDVPRGFNQLTSIYDVVKNIYKSSTGPMRRIVFTDKPVSIETVMDSIQKKTCFVFLTKSNLPCLNNLFILHEHYIIFDYIIGIVAKNHQAYKNSFCVKCKQENIATDRIKIINNTSLNVLNDYVNFIETRFKQLRHTCTSL